MNYAKDLLQVKRKSKVALIISIVFYSMAISWIPLRLIEKNSISGFDWIYMSMMFLNGLSLTMSGLGYSIERLIGQAFIHIDHEVIKIKPGIFDNEQRVYWDEVNSIGYKASNFIITKNDASTCKLTLTKLEYADIQDIKHVIHEIADKKNLEIH